MAGISGEQLYELMTEMQADMADLVSETRELVQERKAMNAELSEGAAQIRQARDRLDQRANPSSFHENRA